MKVNDDDVTLIILFLHTPLIASIVLHRGEGHFVYSEGTSLRGNLPPRSPAVNPRSGRVSSEKPHRLLLSDVTLWRVNMLSRMR